MKRALSTTVLLAFVAGCTPTPEQTCKKLDQLGSREKDFELNMSKCLKKMRELEERDPDGYKCAAKMVSKLSSLDTALMAISLCDKSKGQKKSSDDDDDAPKKKKKKSSDDD